jgi:hypothetical protein
MAQHVKILGILHIVFGGLGVLAAIFVLLIFGGISAVVGLSDHSSDSLTAIPILGLIGGFVFILVLVLSLPGLIIGIGLMQFKPWARIAGIVLSALDLVSVPPFGTALGIYGLWVLLNRETEQMFAPRPVRAA